MDDGAKLAQEWASGNPIPIAVIGLHGSADSGV
jgi:hypothetical protein